MEKFSVLLSVYSRERAEYMREALRSVFQQTSPPDEVILVKDGPLNEELDAVVEEFSRHYTMFKVVPLPYNVGLGMALNEGLKHCSYELVARMDTDDIC
ncbi:MAG: glycosyltransferase, partial [Mucinivorans sp.]